MKNILFCGNEKMFDGMLSCMLSILMRTKSREAFCFYLFTMDVSRIRREYRALSAAQAAYLEQVARQYDSRNRVKRMDVSAQYEKEFAGCPNERNYCSPYSLLRLLADQFDEIPDKLLYLDVDVLFQRDVSLLYDICVEDCEYAAARDHYGKFLVHPDYINSGVLLFNMKRIRRSGLFAKARHLVRTRKLLFADQTALYRSSTKIKMLPQRFNDQKFLHKNTVARHFSRRLFYLPYPRIENVKQWDVAKIHRIFGYTQFDDILFEYIYRKRNFEKEQVIPIFFACDEGFLKITCVALASLMANASKRYRYHVHILCARMPERAQEKVRRMAESNFTIFFDDMGEELRKWGGKMCVREGYSVTTYFRLFIPDKFPQYDRVLYLDSDMVILGDVSELYFAKLGDAYVGAVQDQMFAQTKLLEEYAGKVLGMEAKEYFNAGMLVIACDAFRRDRMLERFLELCGRYAFVVAQDQDYLNVLCKGRVRWLEEKWNAETCREIGCVEEELRIIHYNFVSKPWRDPDCPLAKYFWQYAERTEDYEDLRRQLEENLLQRQAGAGLDQGGSLYGLVLSEIEREDNYLRMTQREQEGASGNGGEVKRDENKEKANEKCPDRETEEGLRQDRAV